jgi:hypothetical protein
MKSIHLLAVLSLGVLAGSLASPLKADNFNKETVVKIDNPMNVSGTVLLPGRYVFELASTQTAQDVVYIRDAHDFHLIATVLGSAAYRPIPPDKSTWTFYPTAPGQVATLKAWFFSGDNNGVRFRNDNAPARALAQAPTAPTGAVGGMK